MAESHDAIVIVVACVIAFVLQIVVAPYIALGNALPNFVVAFVFLCAILRFQAFGCVMPFVVGLAFDFVCGSVVGAMAFSLTLFSVVAARAFFTLNNDTLFMPFVIMALGLILTEATYGIVLIATGYQAGFLEAFVYRALPCALYDFVVAILFYPLAARFFRGGTQSTPIMTTQLR